MSRESFGISQLDCSRLAKVLYSQVQQTVGSGEWNKVTGEELTFPVPEFPTSTNLTTSELGLDIQTMVGGARD